MAWTASRRGKRITWLPLIVLIALTGGCNRGAKPAGPTHPTTAFGAEHRFAITVGDQTTHMRLAIHDSERSRGLMEVTTMAEDEGMLFVWARPQQMSFYMRNTRLPLDIGYFDRMGVLREIYPMYPGVEDTIPSVSKQMQLALEMNQGWYAHHEVKPGATIDLAALRTALRERGYDPEKYFPEK